MHPGNKNSMSSCPICEIFFRKFFLKLFRFSFVFITVTTSMIDAACYQTLFHFHGVQLIIKRGLKSKNVFLVGLVITL